MSAGKGTASKACPERSRRVPKTFSPSCHSENIFTLLLFRKHSHTPVTPKAFSHSYHSETFSNSCHSERRRSFALRMIFVARNLLSLVRDRTRPSLPRHILWILAAGGTLRLRSGRLLKAVPFRLFATWAFYFASVDGVAVPGWPR